MAIDELTTRERVLVLRALLPCLTATKVAEAARVSRERVRQLLNEIGDETWLEANAGRTCWDGYEYEKQVLTWVEEGTINMEQAAGLLVERPDVKARLAIAKERIANGR